MSDIDSEKLERAIKASYVSAQGGVGLRTTVSVYIDEYETLREAARAHLATLPRYKEVEVVRWGVFTADGSFIGTFEDHGAAGVTASYHRESSIVRLTGTAKVKVTP